LPRRSSANRDIPIFMAHGTYDQMIRLEWGRSVAPCARRRRLQRRVAHVSDAALGRDGRDRRDQGFLVKVLAHHRNCGAQPALTPAPSSPLESGQ
jgi:hypothetical protein